MTLKQLFSRLLFTVCSLGLALLIQSPGNAADISAGADEVAIRAQLDAIARYTTGKENGPLSSLWAKDAVYTDGDGDVFKGLDQLGKRFDDAKAAHANQTIALISDGIRMLSPAVAEADGSVRCTDAAGHSTLETRFSIVLTKEDGKWLIASASETPITTPRNIDYLKGLAWLIGDWTADSNGKSLRMHAAWHGHSNFIRLFYEIRKDNKPLQDDTEIIGYDPRTQQVTSWYFDSTGSIGQGAWQQKDSQWQVDVSKISLDGGTRTERQVIAKKDDNSFTWQALDRTADGVPCGDSAELRVVRAK